MLSCHQVALCEKLSRCSCGIRRLSRSSLVTTGSALGLSSPSRGGGRSVHPTSAASRAIRKRRLWNCRRSPLRSRACSTVPYLLYRHNRSLRRRSAEAPVHEVAQDDRRVVCFVAGGVDEGGRPPAAQRDELFDSFGVPAQFGLVSSLEFRPARDL